MRSISCGGCIEPFIVTALVLALVRNLSRLQAHAWLAPCRYDFYCGPPLCHASEVFIVFVVVVVVIVVVAGSSRSIVSGNGARGEGRGRGLITK